MKPKLTFHLMLLLQSAIETESPTPAGVPDTLEPTLSSTLIPTQDLTDPPSTGIPTLEPSSAGGSTLFPTFGSTDFNTFVPTANLIVDTEFPTFSIIPEQEPEFELEPEPDFGKLATQSPGPDHPLGCESECISYARKHCVDKEDPVSSCVIDPSMYIDFVGGGRDLLKSLKDQKDEFEKALAIRSLSLYDQMSFHRKLFLVYKKVIATIG